MKKKRWLSIAAAVTKNAAELSSIWAKKISPTSFKRAKQHANIHGAGNIVVKPIPPRQLTHCLSREDKNIVINYYKKAHISKETTKRTKINKTTTVTTHYLIVTITKAYEYFKEDYKTHERLSKLSFTTFYNLKPKEIKKGKLLTDLCPICEKGKKLVSKLMGKLNKIHTNCVFKSLHRSDLHSGYNCPLEEDLSIEESEEILQLRAQVKLYNSHKKHSQQQREMFRSQKENFEDNEVTIVGDYSENLELNLSGRQESQDYYNKPQRSLLCFVVHTINQKFYFDYLSDDLSHSSAHIYDCYCKMINTPQFKELNAKKINLWWDNAPQQAKTKEFLSYMSLHKNVKNIELTLNFFIEYHGKADCDGHFGLVKTKIKEWLIAHPDECLETSQQIADVIEKINKNFVATVEHSELQNRSKLKLTGIKNYYCFRFHKNKIEATTLSNSKGEKRSIPIVRETIITVRKVKRGFTEKIRPEVTTIYNAAKTYKEELKQNLILFGENIDDTLSELFIKLTLTESTNEKNITREGELLPNTQKQNSRHKETLPQTESKKRKNNSQENSQSQDKTVPVNIKKEKKQIKKSKSKEIPTKEILTYDLTLITEPSTEKTVTPKRGVKRLNSNDKGSKDLKKQKLNEKRGTKRKLNQLETDVEQTVLKKMRSITA